MPSDPLPDWVFDQRRRLGDRIRTIRMDRNLTQEGLAERAGLSRKTISRLELGQISPPVDFLFLVAHGLAMSFEDLVSSPDRPTGAGADGER